MKPNRKETKRDVKNRSAKQKGWLRRFADKLDAKWVITTAIMAGGIVVTASVTVIVSKWGSGADIKRRDEDDRRKIATILSDALAKKTPEPTIAVVNLEPFGERVFPHLKTALGVTDPEHQKNAAEIAREWLRRDRKALFKFLLESFRDRNPVLRLGILKCFGGMSTEKGDRLDEEEKKNLADTITTGLSDEKVNCAMVQSVGMNLLSQAAIVLKLCPYREAMEFLVDIAKNSKCDDGLRFQAVDSLSKIGVDLEGQDKRRLAEALRAPPSLNDVASDPDFQRIVSHLIMMMGQDQ